MRGESVVEQMTGNGWFWLGVVVLVLAGLLWIAAWRKPTGYTLARRARTDFESSHPLPRLTDKDPATGVQTQTTTPDTGRGPKDTA